MITLYRGDDTGGQLGKEIKIAFHCDDAVDMDGVTVRFNLLNVITKEWTNVHDGDILEMFVTHEQSSRLPLGFLFGKIWGEDSSGKVRTFANRLPIIVTHDLRKVYGSDGLDSQDIHVYSSVDWDAIANKPALFPSKVELVDGLTEALAGMVKSVNGKTADTAGDITLTLDSFANKDGEIQVKQTLMVSRDGGQTFNAVAALVDVWNEIGNHNSSVTAHANLMAAIARAYATKADLNNHANNTDIHVTSDEKAGWDDKYTKDEVDDKITRFVAHYLTKRDAVTGRMVPFATHAELAYAKTHHTEASPQFFYAGEGFTPTKNDYCVVLADESISATNPPTTRYSFVGDWPDGQWQYQYMINESAFSQEQWDAINSGITAAILALLAKKNYVDAELAKKLDKSGGSVTGELVVDSESSHAIKVKSGVDGPNVTVAADNIQLNGEDGFEYTQLMSDGTINRGTTDDDFTIRLPAKSGTLATVSDLAASPSTSTALKDRDCALVAYTEGMTFSFEQMSGLRSFEVIVTGCVKDGSINWPAVTYRGESADLIPEDGDNHWTFAEQQDGSFAVTRRVANTFTIGD